MRRWCVRRLSAVLSHRPHTRQISVASANSTPQSPRDETTTAGPPSILLDDGHAAEARSLLRALLRECSYLPDDFVRQWVKQHICASFRVYNTTAQLGNASSVSEQRQLKKFKDGRMALSQLQRAAAGDQWRLQRVLMMAYGRVGKRRRELLNLLLPLSRNESSDLASESGTTLPSVGNGTQGHLEPALRGTAHDADKSNFVRPDRAPKAPIIKFQPHTLPPQLYSLLRSQIQYGPPPLTRANPRRLQPIVPELNTWLRPMPQKRIKNIEKKHYAYLLDRALPPLPQSEWERLRDLACGRVKSELLKPRRGKTSSTDEIGGAGAHALEVVVRYGKIAQKFSKQYPKGAMNQRTLRRLYAKVFSQCPLTQYDEEKKEWQVTWGEQAMLEAAKSAER